MTYEEARGSVICYCVEVCRKAKTCPMNSSTDCCEGAMIEALDKQIKYRWHDLRKNPEDLPEGDGIILVKRDGFTAPGVCDVAWFYDHRDFTYLAWRYVEQFEENDE